MSKSPNFGRVRNFRDKVIWITGASSGIGKEMAVQSAQLGAKLVLSARNETALNNLQKELPETCVSLILPMDMAESTNFHKLAQKVKETFGAIDLVFMSAGVSQRSEVRETSLDIDRRIMEVNYFGNIALAKAVLPIIHQQGSGSFGVMSSIAGKTGYFQRSAYSASKHALHGFFESLRFEEFENNIKVHLIISGPVNTNMGRNAIDASGTARGVDDQMLKSGLDPRVCVERIIRGIQRDKMEITISKGPESMGMKIKALFPRLYFSLARRKHNRD